MENWLKEPTLIGDKVQLIPLQLAHKSALLAAANDGKLWKLWYTSAPSETTIDAYLATAMQQAKDGQSIPFAVVDTASGQIIGTTRYCNIEAKHHRLEIGYTWYAKRSQRTGINTEAKYLLLKHAFEVLECLAVEFRTHWHNQASRRAITRLGAKQDGVLRNHRIDASGNLRDTVVFSIIASEWKTVKHSLEFKMQAY